MPFYSKILRKACSMSLPHIIISHSLIVVTGIILILIYLLFITPAVTTETGFSADDELAKIEAQEGELFLDIENHLSTIITQGGVRGAINLIYAAVQQKKLSFFSCHMLLHQVGHKAYAYYQYDLAQAASLVDRGCQEAYHHGVEAQIVMESVTPQEDIKRFCHIVRTREPKIQCYHGAGHGFMDKSDGDANYALNQCDRIDNPTGVQLCYAGVFSEYGNRIKNLDGHTGLYIFDEWVATKIPAHPLIFCQELAIPYREACSSQFVKLQYTNNIIESLHACMYEGYAQDTQAICIKFSGFFYTDNRLSYANDLAMPSLEFLPDSLRESFLIGVFMGMSQAEESGLQINGRRFCETLSGEDAAFCRTLIHS